MRAELIFLSMFTFCAVTLRKEQQMLEPNQAVEVEVAEQKLPHAAWPQLLML
jgi:hypothetical protein